MSTKHLSRQLVIRFAQWAASNGGGDGEYSGNETVNGLAAEWDK